MTPQSSLMVVAPLVKGGETSLRTLLSSMNVAPGRVDPRNPVVPFGEFDTLHFARFVILDDATTGDIAVYGVQPPAYPLSLAFLADFDGDYASFLRELVQRAGDGLRPRLLSLRKLFLLDRPALVDEGNTNTARPLTMSIGLDGPSASAAKRPLCATR